MSSLTRPTPIDKELYKLLQHYCIDKDVTPRDALEAAIQAYLKANGGKTNDK